MYSAFDMVTPESAATYEDDLLEASKRLQALINSGDVWRFEGAMGRHAVAEMQAGRVMLGPRRVQDYYSNTVPSRHDVQAGTRGSRQRVVDMHGEDWALELESIEKVDRTRPMSKPQPNDAPGG